MEKLFKLLLIIVIISSCSKNNGSSGGSSGVVFPDTLTSGWEKIKSLPAENFTDIFFTDNSNGFAISNNGIYKSTNGGNEWTKINNTTGLLHGAGSNNNAVFVDAFYTVPGTQDGGTTFNNTSYTYPGGGPVGFFDCFFSHPDTCFISSNQYVWKSVNGGLSMDTLHKFSSISPTSNLFFLNGQEGWLVRQDGVYETNDGGTSWIVDTPLVDGYGSIEFADNMNGYFSNYGTINKTTDGGVTWLPVFQSSYRVYTDIDFINVNEGYCSINNRVYKTTDAGSTWTQVAALGNEKIGKIYFTDVGHGWACTSDGIILKFTQ